jgi:hypothetical protein
MQTTFDITLSPIRLDADLTLARAGTALVVNGARLDFADLAPGESRPAEAWDCDLLAGPVTREGDKIRLTLLLPHGAEAPQAVLHPAPLTLDRDGPAPLPGG